MAFSFKGAVSTGVETQEGLATVAAGTSTVLSGGRTWANLVADYDKLRFEIKATSVVSDNLTSATVDVTDIAVGADLRIFDGSGSDTNFFLEMQFQALTTGDFIVTLAGTSVFTSVTIRTIGIKGLAS